MRYDYETKGSIERSPRDDRKAIPSLQSRGKGGNKSWWRRAICCRTRCYAANNRTGKSGESNGSAQPSRRRVGDSKRVSEESFFLLQGQCRIKRALNAPLSEPAVRRERCRALKHEAEAES